MLLFWPGLEGFPLSSLGRGGAGGRGRGECMALESLGVQKHVILLMMIYILKESLIKSVKLTVSSLMNFLQNIFLVFSLPGKFHGFLRSMGQCLSRLPIYQLSQNRFAFVQRKLPLKSGKWHKFSLYLVNVDLVDSSVW